MPEIKPVLATSPTKGGATVEIYETGIGMKGWRCTGCGTDQLAPGGRAPGEAQGHANTCTFTAS